ncbi:hypothetical protein CLV90_1827 [Maribacter spongiicola]|uniref:Glycosyltransferase involved in cell wall biosynthesis n=1 Tax=Maribacter spongiicola TaxID=1206753 RepID=A0A4R7K507_9FLAO|nr:hypothetical protein [Maribacter spongiicola]TDT44749.1 hypothetical protein CLV90_1827 [Maribacter spongiicola]
MKIALIFPNNIFTAPYIDYYRQVLDMHDVEYTLITWNRAGKTENKTIAYENNSSSRNPFLIALNYYRFGQFSKKEILKGKFDKLIVFTPQLGIFLSTFLIKKFSSKVILDIRDYTSVITYFEKRFLKLLKHTPDIFISSLGFTDWLPKNKNYIISHNINIELIKNYLDGKYAKKEFFLNKKIHVDTIGAIRDFQTNSAVMLQLQNNENFQMSFIGKGPAIELLKKEIKNNNIENVKLLGPYEKSQEIKLLERTDFINIIQNNDKISNYAIANRLYLSALLQIPCIARNNTEHSRVIKKYGLGIVMDDYTEIPNKLLKFKESFNKEQFINNCTVFLEDVKRDYDHFETSVQTFITEI